MSDNSSRTLALVSGKGGTGKSVLAANLGVALALAGKKVVLVDADLAMPDLGVYLGLEKSPITLHEVLAGEASVSQALYDGPAGCQVIPSGLSLSGFSRANPQRLSLVIQELSKQFEVVILDCPPGLSKEGVVPLTVAQEAILVVNPDLAALADALRVKMMCEMVDTKLLGAVVNRVGLTKGEVPAREAGSMLDTPVLAVIPEDEEMRKSTSLKVPIVMRKKDNPVSKAIGALARRLAGEEAGSPPASESRQKQKRGSIFGSLLRK